MEHVSLVGLIHGCEALVTIWGIVKISNLLRILAEARFVVFVIGKFSDAPLMLLNSTNCYWSEIHGDFTTCNLIMSGCRNRITWYRSSSLSRQVRYGIKSEWFILDLRIFTLQVPTVNDHRPNLFSFKYRLQLGTNISILFDDHCLLFQVLWKWVVVASSEVIMLDLLISGVLGLSLKVKVHLLNGDLR